MKVKKSISEYNLRHMGISNVLCVCEKYGYDITKYINLYIKELSELYKIVEDVLEDSPCSTLRLQALRFYLSKAKALLTSNEYDKDLLNYFLLDIQEESYMDIKKRLDRFLFIKVFIGCKDRCPCTSKICTSSSLFEQYRQELLDIQKFLFVLWQCKYSRRNALNVSKQDTYDNIQRLYYVRDKLSTDSFDFRESKILEKNFKISQELLDTLSGKNNYPRGTFMYIFKNIHKHSFKSIHKSDWLCDNIKEVFYCKMGLRYNLKKL